MQRRPQEEQNTPYNTWKIVKDGVNGHPTWTPNDDIIGNKKSLRDFKSKQLLI